MSIFTEPTYVRKPSSSWFNLSKENKLTMPMGRLVPVYNLDCVPGDRIKINASVFMRTLAMIAPAYQRYDVSLHAFFVPYRLLWKHWEDFITGGKDGTFVAVPPLISYDLSCYLTSGGEGDNVLVPPSTRGDVLDDVKTDWQDYNDFIVNYVTTAVGSIYDYLGYPMPHYSFHNVAVSAGSGSHEVITSALLDNSGVIDKGNAFSTEQNGLSAFRLSAYSLIFKEWYKDENIPMTRTELLKYVTNVNSLWNNRTDVSNAQTAFLDWLNDVNQPFGFRYDVDGYQYDWKAVASLFCRSWRKDYFTSALPWAQRGDVANVVTTGYLHLPVKVNTFTNAMRMAWSNGGEPEDGPISLNGGYTEDSDGNNVHPTNLIASDILSSVFNVNDIRRMFAVQSWLERNARGGARYVEQILAHFGVRVPDSRLMRSEYIGGFSQPIQISAVEQTGTYSDMDDIKQPLGNLAGRGTTANSGFICDYNVQEHGLIMCIASVLPRASYQQGVSRFLRKTDKFDFYFPEFAHLGEQEIKNEELFYNYGASESTGLSSLNNGTFGYQMRYSEYKCANDEVHGDMLQSLSYWHDGRIFGAVGNYYSTLPYNRPALNQSFLSSSPSLRPFALSPTIDTTLSPGHETMDITNVLMADFGFDVMARRPMPYFAEPKLVG